MGRVTSNAGRPIRPYWSYLGAAISNRSKSSEQRIAAVDREILTGGVCSLIGQEIDRCAEQLSQGAVSSGRDLGQDLRLPLGRIVDALDALHGRGHVARPDRVQADAVLP